MVNVQQFGGSHHFRSVKLLYRRHLGSGPCGDDDVGGGIVFRPHRNRPGIFKPCRTLDECNAGHGEKLFHAAAELSHDCGKPLLHTSVIDRKRIAPVLNLWANRSHRAHDISLMAECLSGDAAHVKACAAHFPLFDDDYLQAVAGRIFGSPVPPRATADNDKVSCCHVAVA